MIRPGTDWQNEAPRILCESTSSGLAGLLGGLAGLGIGGPWGVLIGRVLGGLSAPAINYGLCGNYGSSSTPLDGENQLPEPNTVLDVKVTRTITVEISKPPKQLNERIARRIYKDESREPRGPGSTRFPLYRAISAGESLRNKKFGCILYQPVSDEPIKLDKCNVQTSSSNLEEEDKKRLAEFIVEQKSVTLAMGVAIMSTMSQGRVGTGIVIGPYILSATATAYAAFNKQLYSAPITKVPKKVEYRSCTIPPPSINVPFSIKKDTQVNFEPFIEITSPLGGVSN